MSDSEQSPAPQPPDLDSITRQAAADYRARPHPYTNRYPLGTPEHDAYERGFWQAYRRHPTFCQRLNTHSDRRPYADDYCAGRTPWWIDD